jgi:hypothetical protein
MPLCRTWEAPPSRFNVSVSIKFCVWMRFISLLCLGLGLNGAAIMRREGDQAMKKTNEDDQGESSKQDEDRAGNTKRADEHVSG